MENKKRKQVAIILILLLIVVGITCILYGTEVVYAAGLIDDTINAENMYSKYPLSHYQLDFYVDKSWDWLPWNWNDGLGKSVMYGIYCITNFIWIISLYLSNATGYVVKEAYTLDFINDMADSIGKGIQTIAGVTERGFMAEGFYIGFLLLLVLVLGVHVTYTGLLKRETSKAIQAIVNFTMVFVISAACIAYAPDYIKKINEFSIDVSTAALNMGTKIVMPDTESAGRDSVDMIRNSLYSIQVEQPWLLLQYGNSDKDTIGKERVEELLTVSPKSNSGKDREEIVKEEIENRDNQNMTLPEVVNRLGMVFFIMIFNIGITIFVFLLMSMMILSQVLFIVFSMFLPVSFLLSMIPGQEGIAKKGVIKIFNCIMTRAGITLIISIAFSISTMLYTLSNDKPFFIIAFLQIVVFAGIYMKLGDIMNMFSLQSADSQEMGRKLFRRPYRYISRRAHGIQRRIIRTVKAGATSAGMGTAAAYGMKKQYTKPDMKNGSKSNERSVYTKGTANVKRTVNREMKPTIGEKLGKTAGAAIDLKDNMRDKVEKIRLNMYGMPTQASYSLHSGIDNVKQNVSNTVQNGSEKVKENVSDFKSGMQKERENRQIKRNRGLYDRRMDTILKKEALEDKKRNPQKELVPKRQSNVSKRPVGTVNTDNGNLEVQRKKREKRNINVVSKERIPTIKDQMIRRNNINRNTLYKKNLQNVRQRKQAASKRKEGKM